ncbi:MAG: isoprenylcysteine carboxylmethyltransferase family protein [Deltaproteobacteria bacterium]|uniref:Isoprenylcysteine carboxylmethyltransferase family protein n=1 Tax=Candidatus Zymogenus saltonus TaxID=2844893 RepID=A0A9D8PNF4_9DELT|nr:isoprenylcysteine carboxylmethyltransferase family protein [Candidatus Zymogenus saltonus]
MDSFDYFQLINLSIFYLIFIGRIVQLILSGINPIVLGTERGRVRAYLEKSIFFGLALWTFEAVSICLGLEFHLFSDLRLFSIMPLRISGVILEAAAMIIFVFAVFSFGRSWRVGIDTKTAGKLVTGGVFSVTRNPIFLFLNLFFLGTFLIYPTIFFAVSAFVVVLGNHLQVIQEERFLEKQYGKEYLEYKRDVRRYL